MDMISVYMTYILSRHASRPLRSEGSSLFDPRLKNIHLWIWKWIEIDHNKYKSRILEMSTQDERARSFIWSDLSEPSYSYGLVHGVCVCTPYGTSNGSTWMVLPHLPDRYKNFRAAIFNFFTQRRGTTYTISIYNFYFQYLANNFTSFVEESINSEFDRTRACPQMI